MNYIQKPQKAVLSCRAVSKKFDQLEVLKDVTFTLHKGQKVGLVGPNGSGKSTLLQMIARLVPCDSGTITYSKDLKLEYLPQLHLNSEGLSGGEMAKKILAPIMNSDASLFLLDEPTNNLDADGLTVVESFILKSTKTFLVVSHDRAFLDKVVTKIIEIDPDTASSYVYEGNYSAYIEEKEHRIERQWKEYADKVEKVEKFNHSIDERLSRMEKIEQARKGIRYLPIHEKEKPVAATLRDKEAKAGRRAKLLKNRLAKYTEETDDIIKPQRLLPLKIRFEYERGSTTVFELDHIMKTIGTKRIGPITFSLQYGERLHIVGPNGSGKTTVLKMLLGELKADSGILKRGENVKVGYIAQRRGMDKSEIKVIDHFLASTDLTQTDARKILNRFRITTEDVVKNVSSLSPGEYSRLMIAELAAIKPNCIILDEPSNHLDLEVLEELENALVDFKGTLIIVSHDRYFIQKLKFDKILTL